MSNAAQLTGAMSGSSSHGFRKSTGMVCAGTQCQSVQIQQWLRTCSGFGKLPLGGEELPEKEEHHSIADQKTHKSAFRKGITDEDECGY